MLKQCFRNSCSFLLSVLLLGSCARENDEPGKGKREPIVITASRMEADKLGDK